MVIMAIN